MASIILSGTLLDPNSDLAVGDKIRLTHRTTTGETIKGAVSVETIDPSGTYSIELQYGLIMVEYSDVITRTYRNLGVVTVNQDSTATSLPELLNAIVPPTDEQLLEFQSILADCVAAADRAETAAKSVIGSYTLAEAKALTGAVVGQIIQITDRDNFRFLITAAQTSNEYTIISMSASGLSAELLPSNGKITYTSAGYDVNAGSQTPFNTALTEYLSTRNVSLIYDVPSGPLVTTNNDGDLQGKRIDLNGNAYRFSPSNTGGIFNGKASLRDTWKSGAPNAIGKARDLDSIYSSTPPVLSGKKRFPMFVSESDVVTGGNIATWRKCDGSKYWALEGIVTQKPSGLSTSIDESCPAWRLGELSMCDYVQAYRYAPSVIPGGDVEFTRSNIGQGNQKTATKVRQTSNVGEFYEYQLIKPSSKIGVFLMSSVNGCDNVLIEVLDSSGLVVNAINTNNKGAVSDLDKVVSLDTGLENENVTVRITNNGTGGNIYMRVCGVGCVVDNEVTCENIDYISYSAFTTGDNKVRSFFSGAMDYAIMEENLLKFGGESHGGEVMSKQDIYLDGELYAPVTGDYKAVNELRIDQESTTTFPSAAAFDTTSRHRFYSYPAAHDFSASHSFTSGFMARIAYGPMLTTHSEMNKMLLPEIINADEDGFSGSEERYEFGKTEYVRLESTVNPFINEMWHGAFGGQYNESTPWWKIGGNANNSRKYYYGPVSSSSCGAKDVSKQPYSTRSVRVYN